MWTVATLQQQICPQISVLIRKRSLPRVSVWSSSPFSDALTEHSFYSFVVLEYRFLDPVSIRTTTSAISYFNCLMWHVITIHPFQEKQIAWPLCEKPWYHFIITNTHWFNNHDGSNKWKGLTGVLIISCHVASYPSHIIINNLSLYSVHDGSNLKKKIIMKKKIRRKIGFILYGRNQHCKIVSLKHKKKYPKLPRSASSFHTVNTRPLRL